MHVFPFFPNRNPSSQAHSYLCFLLLQIWLHPPLLVVSQGCTKHVVIIQLGWQLYYYVICLQFITTCVYIYIYIYISPLLHVVLSLSNRNPASQEHTCHSFLLLHIWLHPPLFALSQGCTKIGKVYYIKYTISRKSNLLIYADMHILLAHVYINLPFLHVLLSSSNTNPTSQEHSCFSFFLLQIWLQPPLFASSQGCTK